MSEQSAMVEAWRIVKARHASTAFSGEGAAKFGGRWNSRGVPMVYASSSRALAVLETLVHLNPPVRFKFAAFRVRFDSRWVETLDPKRLPRDWRSEPPGQRCKTIGDTWVEEARSAVLVVPSVIVLGESNYLLNPAHPDFRKVLVSRPEPFAFDPRLLA
jgi:RES domain-containing protein